MCELFWFINDSTRGFHISLENENQNKIKNLEFRLLNKFRVNSFTNHNHSQFHFSLPVIKFGWH